MTRDTARDLAIASAISAAFAALYLANAQPWLWGDGYGLAQGLDAEARDVRYGLHVAYAACGRLLRAASGWSAYRALEVVSAVAAALGLSATYLVARRLGIARVAAAIAAVLAGLSPALWFFATAIEVHALHFAAVAWVVLALLALPWERFGRALACAALLAAALPATHLSAPLLGPGLVACVGLAAARQGAPLSARRLVLAVGPALIAGLLVGLAIAQAVRGVAGDALAFGSASRIVRGFPGVPGARWWWEELVVGQGVLFALAIAGVALGARRRGALAVVAAFLVPQVAFHAWWAVENRGGYFLAVTPVLAVLAALAVERAASGARRPAFAAVVLLLLAPAQASLALRTAREAHAGIDAAALATRAQAVRAVTGGRGLLVTFDPAMQPITRVVPGVREHSYAVLVARALELGATPEAVAEAVADGVEHGRRAVGPPLVLDASYRSLFAALPVLAPYFDAIEAALDRRFRPEPIEGAGWPLVRLEPRDG